MATMQKVHIWYALSGEILAVGHPVGKAQCLPIAGVNQNVMETEVNENLIDALHQTHRVDHIQKVTVKC